MLSFCCIGAQNHRPQTKMKKRVPKTDQQALELTFGTCCAPLLCVASRLSAISNWIDGFCCFFRFSCFCMISAVLYLESIREHASLKTKKYIQNVHHMSHLLLIFFPTSAAVNADHLPETRYDILMNIHDMSICVYIPFCFVFSFFFLAQLTSQKNAAWTSLLESHLRQSASFRSLLGSHFKVTLEKQQKVSSKSL